jgi:tetratricopeptide (TPR) repeat protein
MQEVKQVVDLPAEAHQCLAEARTLAEAGRFGGAAQKCERALELAPNWAEAHHLYGTVLEQMGFVEKAEAAYDRATLPDAVSVEVQAASARCQQLLDKASVAREAGKLGSALRACEAALAANPNWAEAHNMRGLVLDDMGHAEEAIAAYREAIRLNPSFDDARRNLLGAGAALDDDTDGEFSGLVVVRTFGFPTEAEIARGRLEAEGIPAVVTQGEIVAMNWLLSNMVGGVKLCVREEDASRRLPSWRCWYSPRLRNVWRRIRNSLPARRNVAVSTSCSAMPVPLGVRRPPLRQPGRTPTACGRLPGAVVSPEAAFLPATEEGGPGLPGAGVAELGLSELLVGPWFLDWRRPAPARPGPGW